MMPDDNSKEPFQLTEESRCIIHSLGDRNTMLVSRGIFKGYSRLGNAAEAICLELDESHGDIAGKTRLIPSHVVLAIDLIEVAEERDEETPDDMHAGYYG